MVTSPNHLTNGRPQLCAALKRCAGGLTPLTPRKKVVVKKKKAVTLVTGDSLTGGSKKKSVKVSKRRTVTPSQKVKAFPVEVFPREIQRFIEDAAAAFPCPVDYVGTLMLGVLASFIGRKRSIQVKASWVEHPVLWIALAVRSGDRKSPVFNLVIEPLKILQKILQIEYTKAMAEWLELDKEDRKETPKPQLVQVITTDATVEALKDVLSANSNGVLFAQDELTGWARAMSQYKGGGGDDRQIWLSLWSSTQIVTNRKGYDHPIIINDPFVCVLGGLQPAVLGELADKDHREDGFLARILFSCPDPMPTDQWTEDTVDSTAYHRVCETLWNLAPEKRPVEFSKAAKKVWVSWVNRHRRKKVPDHLRSSWAKEEGHCLRLALVLFEVRKATSVTKATKIDVESIEGAIQLVGYFGSHATRVYERIKQQADDTRVGKAVKWIRTRGGTVTSREVQRGRVASVKSASEAVTLLKDLVEANLGTVKKLPKNRIRFTLGDV